VRALLDNDILVKGSCYGLVSELAESVPGTALQFGVLGAARYVVPDAIRRTPLTVRPDKPIAVFLEFLAEQQEVEPTAEERRLAATLEAHAQQLALSLDAGESQLAAILIGRGLPYLATGDKRAITSLEKLVDTDKEHAALSGKIICLEQLVGNLMRRLGVEGVREAICSEPQVDKTMTICFACHSDKVTEESVAAGMDSYVRDLRLVAVRTLVVT
jgi:hypothetical protein